jgi:predicted RecA/RadA family phage recombinase
MMAQYLRGKPIMQNYVNSGALINAGDVVLVGTMPAIAHTDIPAYTGGTTFDALACRGGIYQMTADVATYTPGTYVYWNNTAKQVTTTAAGNTKFGWVVGGGNDLLSDPAGATVSVLHEPTL